MGSLQNVLLLPGLLDDKAMWRHQIDGLSDIANPIALDLVNHDSISESAEWVLSQAPDTFALAGFSMGGYVAFEIMRRAPERVSRLALIDTSARPDTPERATERKTLIARAEAGHYADMVDEVIPKVLHPSRADDHELVNAIREMAMRIGADAYIRQQKLIMSRPDSRNDLAGIVCPSIVVCGREDTLTPPGLSDEMAEGIPVADLFLVDECNHYAPMEQPTVVTDILRQWLAGKAGALTGGAL